MLPWELEVFKVFIIFPFLPKCAQIALLGNWLEIFGLPRAELEMEVPAEMEMGSAWREGVDSEIQTLTSFCAVMHCASSIADTAD